MTYKVLSLNLESGVLDQFLDECRSVGLAPGSFASICVTAIVAGAIREKGRSPYERIDWPRMRHLIQDEFDCGVADKFMRDNGGKSEHDT